MAENPLNSNENTLDTPENILGDFSQTQNPQENTTGTLLDNLILTPEEEQKARERKLAESMVGQSIGEKTSPLFDINFKTLEDIILYTTEKEYDYVILDPQETQVEISFRKDTVVRETKFIKFSEYTNILLKTKQVSGLILEDTRNTQDGKGKISIGSNEFALISRTAPGPNGEKIFLKSKKLPPKEEVQNRKKVSAGKVMGFIGTILFIGLILFGTFIGFIVFNANDIEDVKFFQSLGINLSDINSFILTLVNVIFSILLMLVTSVFSFSLFKFLRTNKVYKQKKMNLGILSLFLFIMVLSVATGWMTLYQKVLALPNWVEKERGDLQVFDNDILSGTNFSKEDAYLGSLENLIGPLNLKFDLSNYANNRSNQIQNITKYEWNFGGTVKESFSPEIIQLFDTPGNYEISVTVYGENFKGEKVSQTLSDNIQLSISKVVNITESKTSNGGLRYSFDASSLKDLGEIGWYLYNPDDDEESGAWEAVGSGYTFIPRKIFFEPSYIGLSLSNGNNTEDMKLDKVFRVGGENTSEITGEISYTPSLDNDLEYEFSVKNINNSFANGFIEKYDWSIEGKTYNTKGEYDDSESEKVTHTFSSFGDKVIQVTLTDSAGKSITLEKTLSIQKQLKLANQLEISLNGNNVDTLRYNSITHEYYIDDVGIPSTLKFDAKYLKADNIRYTLQKIEWDEKDDGQIDGVDKSYNLEIYNEGNHNLSVTYTFVHRNNSSDTIKLKEQIYVDGVIKDAVLNLQMIIPSNYVPVTVGFDASKSTIKNDNIIKFIYDYGDGISEERDAVNPGHKYSKAGDYVVTLTAVGASGKRYTLKKSLILLPTPQNLEITSSMKKAPIGQGIDFSSSESTGQILEYYWTFGDGEISMEANPTHAYKKPGTYKVTLKAEYANNNSISDTLEIVIE